jgi:hypothetical protein
LLFHEACAGTVVIISAAPATMVTILSARVNIIGLPLF